MHRALSERAARQQVISLRAFPRADAEFLVFRLAQPVLKFLNPRLWPHF
jgi:hypothetical protein